jgi:hypothetical protein
MWEVVYGSSKGPSKLLSATLEAVVELEDLEECNLVH